MSNFAYFNLDFIDINLFSVILYVKGKEYYVFLALYLRKSLQDKVSSCINSRFEIIPTLMRLASEEISSDDIIITESKRVTQKKISDTLGERVSMISLYNEDEDNGLWPLASFDSTVYLPYSFSDEQFQLAVEKATYNALVSETAADIIVGSSEIMRKTRNIIEKAMKSELPVHIIGETGTGKTLAAETIHSYSNPGKEIIREDCGQLTGALAESTLFGHVKGAFSGAINDRKGLIASADKSTLFLDEIQDLNLEIQSKLLSVIETGNFRKIGSDKPIHSSFRLITAGSCPLSELVKLRKMRKDFYYRINYMEIRMPSLNEHMEDIPELIKNYEMQNGYIRKRIVDYKPFMHDFPGNVRELYRDVRLFHEGVLNTR